MKTHLLALHRPGLLALLWLVASLAMADDLKPSPAPNPNSLTPAPLVAGQVDPMAVLGLTLQSAYDLLGAPQEILTAKIDDKTVQPVHFYSPSLYLFWHQNHVWQVRLDKRTAGDILGLKMGQTREEVAVKLGKPLGSGDNWDVYQLPYKNFPRRVRLVYDQAKVTDLYVYRSDF